VTRPRIDFSINLGGVAATVAILVTLAGLAANVSARLTAIEVKIDPLWRAYLGNP